MSDNLDEVLSPIIHDITARTELCMRRQGIKTVRQLSLLTYQECSNLRSVGNKTMDELTAVLQQYGLTWRLPPCAVCGHRSESAAGQKLHMVSEHPETVRINLKGTTTL